MRLRNAEVLARCDASGELVSKDGRVEVRYKPNDGRAYFASASNLKPPAGAQKIEPDSFCGPGEAVKKPSKSKKKRSSASDGAPDKPEGDEVLVYADGACSGNPGPAGVGAVAMWADQMRELSEYIGEATNNIAELTGILRAVELAHTKGWSPRYGRRSTRIPTPSFFMSVAIRACGSTSTPTSLRFARFRAESLPVGLGPEPTRGLIERDQLVARFSNQPNRRAERAHLVGRCPFQVRAVGRERFEPVLGSIGCIESVKFEVDQLPSEHLFGESCSDSLAAQHQRRADVRELQGGHADRQLQHAVPPSPVRPPDPVRLPRRA
jgi:hypothetical protein